MVSREVTQELDHQVSDIEATRALTLGDQIPSDFKLKQIASEES